MFVTPRYRAGDMPTVDNINELNAVAWSVFNMSVSYPLLLKKDIFSGMLAIGIDPTPSFGSTTLTNLTVTESVVFQNSSTYGSEYFGQYVHLADVATTAALPSYTYSSDDGGTITATANGALPAIDGQTLAQYDRILVTGIATTDDAHNLLYYVYQVGDGSNPFILKRTPDANTSAEVTSGMPIMVTTGTVYANTFWTLETANPITLGTTALTIEKLEPLAKYNATAAPTVNDDVTKGYSVGSPWFDTTNDKAYDLLDATAGAAVWQERNFGGSVTGTGTTNTLAKFTGASAVGDSGITDDGNKVVITSRALWLSENNSVVLSSGDNDDLSIGDNNVVAIFADSGGTSNITGLAGGDAGAGIGGRIAILLNVDAFAHTIAHDSASSTAANRIYLPASSITVPAQNSGATWGVMVVWDAADNRWIKWQDPCYVSAVATQTANRVLAGPTSGGDAAPTFRALVAADLSDLSGTYTPTLTNVANLDASTAYQCQYMRVGNTVTVSGKVDVDPTLAATSTQLGISLPIASNLGASEDCAGVAFASGIASQGAAILGDATNNRAQMQWISGDVTNQAMYFTFTYEVI